MLLKLVLASGLMVTAAPPVAPVPSTSATPPSFATGNARYQLERAGDGFVRLDRVTGEMSFCRIEPVAGLVCRLGADERSAYDAKLRGLTDELAAGGKPKASLAEQKAAAFGEISLVAYILTTMLHAARDVADTAEQEKLAQHPHHAP